MVKLYNSLSMTEIYYIIFTFTVENLKSIKINNEMICVCGIYLIRLFTIKSWLHKSHLVVILLKKFL